MKDARSGGDKKVLLMGNPNVGKSVIFSRLTGARVAISNYPGTTVGFSHGEMKFGAGEIAMLMDVPGVYSLHSLSRAEEVAMEMLEKGNVVINVVDATNLERNLFLTLELKERGVPVVVALNMWDETRHKGIEIDVARLEKELGIPVVATCGLTGVGIKRLVERLTEAEVKKFPKLDRDHKWEEIGKMLDVSQKLRHHHHTLLERLEDISTRPVTGLPIAALVVYFSFRAIVFIAEGLINYVMDPLFEKIWWPLMTSLSSYLGENGIVHDLLIGKLVAGEVDFGQSFGLLTAGLYVPLAAVLPYIISFYLILGILEDLGYLPRLATQVDNLMHQLGLHGYAILPFILGLGCNVPGAMALRLMESRREKFIAGTLMAIAVPCMAQIAMIVGLVGSRGGEYVALIFGVLFTVFVVKGFILNRVMKGRSPEILWEIPPYRMPKPAAIIKKLWMRVSEFLGEAVPYVLLGILFVNILYISGIFNWLSNIFAPVLNGLWSLPKETISAMIIGFLRKDVAVGMLRPLGLTTKQLVIACTVLAIYFPCLATFIVMLRELGIRDMIKSAGLMLLTAAVVGGLLNLIL
ncbi:MAG: ferrous iron transporter B [Candidatus Omnitrophica bacterium]|nr:ferrous iron transporter B [Candidatus Omnitrophota bacterium]MBU1127919.1 ferrous iron transporter B [Candidatus Omnitrophota bacterium]MBU1851602.1 ferrous iron transporter B [Candidatus Omnitrophota bacterium]